MISPVATEISIGTHPTPLETGGCVLWESLHYVILYLAFSQGLVIMFKVDKEVVSKPEPILKISWSVFDRDSEEIIDLFSEDSSIHNHLVIFVFSKKGEENMRVG